MSREKIVSSVSEPSSVSQAPNTDTARRGLSIAMAIGLNDSVHSLVLSQGHRQTFRETRSVPHIMVDKWMVDPGDMASLERILMDTETIQ